MSTTPNKELLSDESVPRITLGGVDWPVPKLAIAQNAYVEPLIRKHLPIIRDIARAAVESAKAAEAGAGAEVSMPVTVTTEVMLDFATAAYWALRRGHWDAQTKIGITRDEFDNMPMTFSELYNAAFVIGRQAGLFKPEENHQNGVSKPAAPLAVTTTEAAPTG